MGNRDAKIGRKDAGKHRLCVNPRIFAAMLRTYLLIFTFGGLGSIVRAGISSWVPKPASGFPAGTLVANVLACAVFGILYGLIARQSWSQDWRFALLTGFCGGFSTFSTFSAETLALMERGQTGMALLYAGMSVTACLAATWAGMRL